MLLQSGSQVRSTQRYKRLYQLAMRIKIILPLDESTHLLNHFDSIYFWHLEVTDQKINRSDTNFWFWLFRLLNRLLHQRINFFKCNIASKKVLRINTKFLEFVKRVFENLDINCLIINNKYFEFVLALFSLCLVFRNRA